MKASAYNLRFERASAGQVVLYNTLNGALTCWDSDEVAAVDAALCHLGGGSSCQVGEILLDLGYLVADEIDELAVIKERKRAGASDSNRLDVVVMPTLSCNFACRYCYEVPRPGTMSERVERNLTDWLLAELHARKFVLLLWFGGEPLLCVDTIARVSSAVREQAAGLNGVEVAAHVTTNGYLLTEGVAGQLGRAGVLDYQITVDGPAECHDALRVLHDGKATFRRVFDNVIGLLRGNPAVTVTLRVNFNHNNLDRVPELLRAVPEEIRQRVRPVLEPIFGACDLGAAAQLEPHATSALLQSHYSLARSLGFSAPAPLHALLPGKLVYCYAERDAQVVVTPEGDLFKCTVSGFDPSQRVGRLGEGGRLEVDASRWSQWVAPDDFAEDCVRCVYLPLCMGGCRKLRLQEDRRGAGCSLIATNAAHVLKQISLRGFPSVVEAALQSAV